MKKRFWNRLVAAVVTMAMAFSILAVPASAASASWVIEVADPEGAGTIYITDLFVGEFAENEQQVNQFKEILLNQGGGKLSDVKPQGNGVLGLKTEDQTIWMPMDYLNTVAPELKDQVSGMWGSGSGSGSGSSSGSTSSSSAGGGNVAAILVAGGAAIAAVTGVYLYTHPAVVQEIKTKIDDFVESIREKVQELLPAQNAEEVPAAAEG